MNVRGIPKRQIGIKDILDGNDYGATPQRRYRERKAGRILLAFLSTSSTHAVLRSSNLEPQNRLRYAVLIFGGSKLDLCFRLLQLCLA